MRNRLPKGLAFGAATAAALALLAMPAVSQKQKGDAAKGKVVFEQCAVCHDANSTQTKMGPGLKGLFKRSKLKNGKKVTEESVRTWIDKGGNGMPPYEEMLSAEEKDNLIAYLKTL